jgi:peptidoglycan glycosyltransferase
MTNDYIQSREVQRPRGRLRRLVLPVLIALAILIVLLFTVAFVPLVNARDAWLRGRYPEAIATGEKWSSLHLWPARYDQLLAAAYLAAGNEAAARPHIVPTDVMRSPIIPKVEVARRLFARDRYDDFLAYDAAFPDRIENPDVPLYRAAAMLVTNRPVEAQKAFASIDKAHVNLSHYGALQRALAPRATGDAPYVFDRDGGTIAAIRANDVVAINDDFAPLINRDAGALTIGAKLPQLGENATIETTLDPFVQKAALKALGGFRGSIVAIDPRTNEILAIASSRGNGPLANLALEHQYEPGSVVKILTGLNAETGGVDLASLFPYTCKGFLDIDGRRFGDWLPAGHGVLNSIDDALAVSCNVFFADVGIRLGSDSLKRFMTAAGFDSTANLGILQVPLGKTIGPVLDRFETASLAIGLEHESMNALHIAMLASMIANRGVLTTPRLLIQRRSILGDIVATVPKQTSVRLAPPAAAEAIVHSMQAVVSDPKGTGRRALVPGISIAMKTGTAGERKSGLEAVILAFAPVESPKIAFGVIAEDAGPAEFAGAKIAHDFLEVMRDRLK